MKVKHKWIKLTPFNIRTWKQNYKQPFKTNTMKRDIQNHKLNVVKEFFLKYKSDPNDGKLKLKCEHS